MSVAGALMLIAGFVVAVGARPLAAHVHGHPAQPVHASSAAKAADDSQGLVLGNAAALRAKSAYLPPASAPPAAAPAALVSAPPLAGREDFAFAPYWSLAQEPTFTLTGLSTLAYFSVGVNPNGTLEESGPGWNGYQSQALADLITRAHAANERVVLTIDDFDQGSLDALTSSPTAPATLAAQLIPALQAKNLDGLNFDLEGAGSRDQAGLTSLVSSVSGSLRAANPHWQITMDTYASSAGDPGGFFNVPALAQFVDAFFVMAYELNLQGTQSAVSPLTSGAFSDLTVAQQYTAVVPANKVIMGTPFFGIDWPTNNGTLQAQPTGPAVDIADSQVTGTNDPIYWDPVTDTGWTSYQVGNQWHESFFEDPYSLSMVAQLVTQHSLRGVGIWALGMEDNGPQWISALDGFAPPGNPGSAGPQSTSESPPPGSSPGAAAPATSSSTSTPSSTSTTTSTSAPGSTSTTKPAPTTTTSTTSPAITGTYEGKTWNLTPAAEASVSRGLAFGTLYNFTTADPAYSCLNGKSLSVYLDGSLVGHYVAVAVQPTDCINQDFTFGT
ncbi:MAG TPA: glycosyl hydrolase family 18 protein [Acidimicrobiales bacterium]|nr:glycosyl hydrolase family 18 protein [Acidimicrobiales bacterium]